jgi:hypothetical protein
MPRKPLVEIEIQTLKALREIALAGKGWRRGTVRGWVLGVDVNDLVNGWYGAVYHLPRLRLAGWVQSEPVRDPGRPRNQRITQAGEDELARVEGRAPAVIEAPHPVPSDNRQIFVSRRVWACLAVLQRHDAPVTWRDVERGIHERFGFWIYPDHVQMLLNRGFAEREERGSGREKVTWLAATPLGRAVRLADGAASESIVQLRLPRCAPAP